MTIDVLNELVKKAHLLSKDEQIELISSVLDLLKHSENPSNLKWADFKGAVNFVLETDAQEFISSLRNDSVLNLK
jgi:hypothetical protein